MHIRYMPELKKFADLVVSNSVLEQLIASQEIGGWNEDARRALEGEMILAVKSIERVGKAQHERLTSRDDLHLPAEVSDRVVYEARKLQKGVSLAIVKAFSEAINFLSKDSNSIESLVQRGETSRSFSYDAIVISDDLDYDTHISPHRRFRAGGTDTLFGEAVYLLSRSIFEKEWDTESSYKPSVEQPRLADWMNSVRSNGMSIDIGIFTRKKYPSRSIVVGINLKIPAEVEATVLTIGGIQVNPSWKLNADFVALEIAKEYEARKGFSKLKGGILPFK